MIEDISWLTMKQVTEQTDIRAATVNRYKEDFSEYIHYRYNASNMLEFDSRSLPVLQKIYELYRDRSAGRMTTEKVKQLLLKEYQPETYEIHDLTTTPSPVEEQTPIPYQSLLRYLKGQEERFTVLEEQNHRILNQQNQILSNQGTMQQVMNQHYSLLSEVARSKMEERKQTFWQRIFGKREETHVFKQNNNSQA